VTVILCPERMVRSLTRCGGVPAAPASGGLRIPDPANVMPAGIVSATTPRVVLEVPAFLAETA
jgi:hypothetical protein